MNVDELLTGLEVTFHVVNATFHLTFMPWGVGHGGADQEAVMKGHTPVSVTQHRIKHQGFQNTRFQVVRYHPFGYTPKTLEGSLVQGNPGRYFLVKHQFRILMTAVAKGSYEYVRGPRTTADRVTQLS
jgi:hypothetical protein